MLSVPKIKELQRAAQKAIYDNAHGDIGNLVEDLGNSALHVFGNHIQCKDYYCNNVGENNVTYYNEFRASGLCRHIQGTIYIIIFCISLLNKLHYIYSCSQLINP